MISMHSTATMYVDICSVLLLHKHIGWHIVDVLPPLVHDQAIGAPLESTICRQNGDSYAVINVISYVS